MITNQRGEFGISTILSIAAALIVAAFVLIPGVREFANLIIDSLNSWWVVNVAPEIFPTI